LLALLAMKFTPPDDMQTLFVLDCITHVAPFTPVFYLCIALAFVRGWSSMPRWTSLLFFMPALNMLLCSTNSLHHLQYRVFSIIKSEIVFGPFVIVIGIYSYISIVASMVIMLRFAARSRNRLYLKQCLLVSLGGVCPLVVSALATFTDWDISIAATAMGFLPLILCNGIAIYQLHLLDITPVATQQVLDWISDCYLILNEKGLVIAYNKPFSTLFATKYGITENRYLRDCVKKEDISGKTAIYNMITAVDACLSSQSTVSYEQAAIIERAGVTQKNYYVTEVSALVINEKPAGFVIIFKDITLIKKSTRQLQKNQKRMLEQERFAFLGQMIGGLAHNLKTPIMSISGCISAADGLIEECLASLDDPVVTGDDYREIYGEIREWLQKIREASTYMSEIITAIKGQASTVGAYEESTFALDEVIKRTTLLMRHELVSSGCVLQAECLNGEGEITLRGDINNLIQVLCNLISNAIYAHKQTGQSIITVGMEETGGMLSLYVKDRGGGIPERVRGRLFKEMVTSKGAQGSGLGMYISQAVVRGKFGGQMWARDNPEGGAIIGMTIPLTGSASGEGAEEEGRFYETT
jgi:signal transduction histidine kinase